MYGIIDLGSNTIHLKIYKKDKNKLVELLDKKEFTKLASYVDDGFLNEVGINRCINILTEFKETLKLFNIKEYYVIATASLRNINNRDNVIEIIKNETGLDIIVLSGEDEGLFDYYGVRLKENLSNGLIVDIGGGSTEIVFVKDNEAGLKISIPYGSLNIYKGCSKNKFPNQKEYRDIKKVIKEELSKYNLPDFAIEKLIGVGGTIRALKKISNSYENDVEFDEINRLIKLSKKDEDTYENLILNVIPERIYTITPGLIILRTIMKFYGINNVTINNYGLREGYLDYILRNKENK